MGEIFRAQIHGLKGPPNTQDKGFLAPLNIFLFQELQRLQRIIGIVRSNLKNLSMAIDGTVVMTVELLQDLNAIYDARVPKRWTHDASGAEISWLLPNMGGWFTGLVERQAMLNTWLENSRSSMKAYWLTGFTNAQGFLTGMRQEVTRQHKKDQWALDDVVNFTEVMPYDLDRVKDVPEEGQNIHGLFIEGGKWNRQEGKLDESEPKKLFLPMPVIYITGITASLRRSTGSCAACPSWPRPSKERCPGAPELRAPAAAGSRGNDYVQSRSKDLALSACPSGAVVCGRILLRAFSVALDLYVQRRVETTLFRLRGAFCEYQITQTTHHYDAK